VIAHLVDNGHLDYDEKIIKYWPEFGQGNKENVTLESLLGHRAGLTYLDRRPTLKQTADLDQLAELLAAQSHNFDGRPVQGYHAVSQNIFCLYMIVCKRVHLV
jgi:CubicO group peptidase (beta-lactamase class C family)